MLVVSCVLQRCDLRIQPSEIHGLGVFAQEKIAKEDIIEECPVIVLPEQGDGLANYCFKWEDGQPSRAMALGYGAVYNHSLFPNAEVRMDKQRGVFRITAKRNIEPNEEITISYGRKWFVARDMDIIVPSLPHPMFRIPYLWEIILIVCIFLVWLYL